VIWGYAIMILLFHLALPLAFDPWLFSWTGVILVPLGNYIFCSIGIGLCFHRTLTHRGLAMPKWLEHFFAVLGVCSLQDSPARWVAVHRMHHQYSDEQPDPHSPLAGFFWGHMEWLFVENRTMSTLEFYDKYARDVLRDPFYMAFERNLLWFWTYVAHAALFFLAGFGIGWWQTGEQMGGVQFGLSLLLWGVIFRTIYTWHVTWAVNSVAHVWGYRNYRTTDSSRNHWLVALATNGEGWHNNHHADQRAAAHGHRWWELDVTWLTILLLERVGLVWDVVRPRVIAKEA
jgi:stearoyl-CoA desaturase (delta-9 desaturase)